MWSVFVCGVYKRITVPGNRVRVFYGLVCYIMSGEGVNEASRQAGRSVWCAVGGLPIYRCYRRLSTRAKRASLQPHG